MKAISVTLIPSLVYGRLLLAVAPFLSNHVLIQGYISPNPATKTARTTSIYPRRVQRQHMILYIDKNKDDENVDDNDDDDMFDFDRFMAQRKSGSIRTDNDGSFAMSDTETIDTATTMLLRPDTNFGNEMVPVGQRPVNEYLELSNSFLFNWARDCTTSSTKFITRLSVVYALLFVLISYPITTATYIEIPTDVNHIYMFHRLAASHIGTFTVTFIVLLRIYVGYQYIGQRLQETTIEYEETGWYDGAVEPKTPNELLRDQMLYNDQVAPILQRLTSIVQVSTIIWIVSVLFFNIFLIKFPPQTMDDQYNPTLLQKLSYDDRLADVASQNSALIGKPAYCDSRYYRAIANGGLGCN